MKVFYESTYARNSWSRNFVFSQIGDTLLLFVAMLAKIYLRMDVAQKTEQRDREMMICVAIPL